MEAAEKIRERGFNVELAPNIAVRDRYLAGSDDGKLEVLHRWLADSTFRAFLFSRGGYGLMRILDRIDYSLFERDPRPMVGFSDVTALHQALAVRGFASFHGPMLNSDFYDNLSPAREEWFWRMLEGAPGMTYQFDDDVVVASEGTATGTLFGGCLSLTHALLGTPFDYWPEGGVWFWEDVEEPTYKIDRMLTALRLSGKLQSIQGVLVGKLKDCGASDPEELDHLLDEFFGPLGVPVVRQLPFGHYGDNLTLPIGSVVRVDTRERTLLFPESAVSFGPA